MNWNSMRWLWVLLLGALCVPVTQAQNNNNLGDYARQVRKQKAQAAPASKKFDNDNLPMTDKLSVVGEAPAPPPDAPATEQPAGTAEAKPADATAAKTEQTAQPAQPAQPQKDPLLDKQKANQDWQKRIQGVQSQIDMLARELDVANREYRLRAAAFYADAGNRLRNSGAWDKEDTQYKDQIAAKQKQLDDLKKDLEDLQEQARKAGVPSGMRE